ncbi:MarR family winged helix-turn-helix transcriptional regulator [Nocardioides sp. DS6]|uniref:MarR family winged helix-turn-helix transcriptional regulator n=1 Tax=Nocardioides eburneus TaxID=3231482 RepID=A0ABV3SVK5_9ACTN
MPTLENIARTDAGLASVLRISVMRLRRRLANERHPSNVLSLGSMAVLGALVANGETTLGELAARERVQPPSMTRTVNFLEEGGFVTRRPGDSDRRQVLVSITEKGRKTVKADRASRDAWLAQRLSELSPDEIDVIRRAAPILERIASQ